MSFSLQTQGVPVPTHPLAHVRASRGWSQQRLAELLQRHARASRINLGTGKNRIWRWENYGTIPDEETQLLLAELLEVSAKHVAEHPWPHWLPAWEDVRFTFPWTRGGSLQALHEAAHQATADHRSFVGLTGRALTDVAQGWQLVEPRRARVVRGRQRVDGDVAHRVGERIHHLRRMDDNLGGGAIRLLVIEELSLVTGLLHDGAYSAEVSRRLFAAAAELAQLAGWASFDAGLHGAAQRCYVAALHAAHTGRDRPLGAYILACMSEQLACVGLARDAVTLARAAVESTRDTAPAKVTATSRFQLAAALAGTGDVRACARTLESAAGDAAAIDQGYDLHPRWLYWLDSAHLDAMEGRCLVALDHPGQAVEHLQRATQAELPEFVRDGAVHLTWLAEAHLVRGELDKARAVVSRARELAEQVHSTRAGELVQVLQRQLASYDDPTAGARPCASGSLR